MDADGNGNAAEPEACQSTGDAMRASADSGSWSLRKKFVWYLRNRGAGWALRKTVAKLLRPIVSWSDIDDGPASESRAARAEAGDVTLGLQAGDWVRVKSWDEIAATLDEHGRHRGLLWMEGMRQYCGKEYRVMKVVRTLRLEETCEYRTLKDTVLLENVFCDGQGFYDCDRTCFHFWREVWLEKATPVQTGTVEV
jgi:hypothetical protein